MSDVVERIQKNGEGREEHFAATITRLREQFPQHAQGYWDRMVEAEQQRWIQDDLRSGIAMLIGRFGYRVEQDPGNKDLAEVVADLESLLSWVRSAGSREEVPT